MFFENHYLEADDIKRDNETPRGKHRNFTEASLKKQPLYLDIIQ
jgi:hypothetical protein